MPNYHTTTDYENQVIFVLSSRDKFCDILI